MKTISFQPDAAILARPIELRPDMLSLSAVTGFFFAFRIALSYLFFQSDPRIGTIANLGLSVLFLFAALIARAGEYKLSLRSLFSNPVLRWLTLYLLFIGASLLWTHAESRAVAAGYWSGMVMDVLTTLVLLSGTELDTCSDSILGGFVFGSLFVAVVAWLSPTLPDMRIGNENFLHPNTLGLYFALSFLIAQWMAGKQRIYAFAALALGLSELRTLSKTAIVALIITEAIFLFCTKTISRPSKIRIAVLAGIILTIFSGLFIAYADLYANEGNSPETLTGRTAIWATAIIMSIESPWFGHGLYSFRSLVPAFGSFEPWHAHNEFLQQLFEFGLTGVVIVASMYGSLFRFARRYRADSLGETALLLVVFSLIRGLADTINFGLSLPLWMFVLLACTLPSRSLPIKEAA